MQAHPNSSHFLSLLLCFLFSANWAAEPAVTLASSRALDCSVDVFCLICCDVDRSLYLYIFCRKVELTVAESLKRLALADSKVSSLDAGLAVNYAQDVQVMGQYLHV